MGKLAEVGDWVERRVAGSLLASDLHGESRWEVGGLAELRRGIQDGGGQQQAVFTDRRDGATQGGCVDGQRKEKPPGTMPWALGSLGASRGTEVREEGGVLDGTASPESTHGSPHPMGT